MECKWNSAGDRVKTKTWRNRGKHNIKETGTDDKIKLSSVTTIGEVPPSATATGATGSQAD